jgi:cation diffusion facilitator CzcD-associated flavoprotein CzcO
MNAMDALPLNALLPLPDAEARLAALAERVRWELATLSYPARPWVRPLAHPEGPVHDVAIVGAGQCGLATAFALRQCAIPNVLLLDSAPAGATGIWRRFARMATLRTPKHVTGPELGFPALSIRAWFEARFGEAAWAALGKIGREDWDDYLNWLAQMLALPIAHGWRVTALTPERDGVLLLEAEATDGARRRVLARHVVLATGMDGNGAWAVPRIVSESLPRERYAHSAEPIDFARLRGRRVAVIGAGASAFDNAAMALEHGAVRVDLLARRESLPRVNPNRWLEFHGFLSHFADLPDAARWRAMHTLFAMSQPPPQESWDRCARHRQFHVQLGAPMETLGMADGAIRIGTPRGAVAADFLILGTGLAIDLARRPELAAIAPHAALWRDRYTPPPEMASDRMGGFPYLGPDLSFTERVPGAAPWITRVRSCSFGALVSTISSAGISMMRPTVERMARGVARQLFLEQADADHAALLAYDERELVSTALAADAAQKSSP